MAIGYGWRAALAISATLLAATAAAAARHPAKSINPFNDKLLSAEPAQRAAMLAGVVGHWCIGTETFLMGLVTAGRGAGNAYWSVRCVDGSTWAVQIDPLGEFTAIDCASYQANGAGKECFKKF
jgi:hypothetical protein